MRSAIPFCSGLYGAVYSRLMPRSRQKFDEFIRFNLTSIVGSETLQFPTGLVFDHCEPIGDYREHTIFGSDGVSPHLSSRAVNETDKVRSTTE